MYFICVSCISTRVSGVWYSTTTLHPSEILFVSCISTFNKGVYSLVSLYLCHSTTFFLYINIQINILAGVLSSTFWCLVSGVWCLVSGVWCLVSGDWCLVIIFQWLTLLSGIGFVCVQGIYDKELYHDRRLSWGWFGLVISYFKYMIRYDMLLCTTW